MGNSFRQQPAPALYGENKTPVTEDVLEVGLVVAFAMIAFSFILIIPGIRGMEVRAFQRCACGYRVGSAAIQWRTFLLCL